MLLHLLDRLFVTGNAFFRHGIVGLGRAGHEFDTLLGNRIGRGVDITRADGNVLNTLALVLLQIVDDLPGLAPILVDRDPDTATGRRQRPAEEPRELALDIEEADFLEVEEIPVELEPDVHVSLEDIVRQVVEIVESHALGMRLGDPVERVVIGRGLVILVDEIDQAAADPDDRGHVHGLARAGVFLGPHRDGVLQRMLGINHPPGHRRCAGSVLFDEGLGVAARLIVDDVGDVTLLPDLDRLGLVRRGVRVSHLGKERPQFPGILVGKLDKFEPVGAGGIILGDRGFRGVVREGTHIALLLFVSCPKDRRSHARFPRVLARKQRLIANILH